MRILLVVLILGVPLPASAQTGLPALPDVDTVVSVGWAGAEHDIRDGRRWHGSLLLSLRGGYYWTDHLKSEIDASWSGAGTHHIYENVEHAGGYTYVISDYGSHDVRVGINQIYQFGRNQWVHPYIGAGVDVVRRAVVIDRPRQSRTIFRPDGNIPIEFAASSVREAIVFAQATLKTGAKMYVTEKAFFDTDLKFGVRRDLEHLVWRVGMGFDF